jgi:hypothetical protein
MTDDDITCTCCTPHTEEQSVPRVGRLVKFDEEAQEWVHVDDLTEASMLHAHIDTSARDCDGPLDTCSVTRPVHLRDLPRDVIAIGERWWETVEVYDFWSRMVSIQVHPYVDHGEATMSLTRDSGGMYTFTQARPTDEGFHHEITRLCRDAECAYERSYQRDHYAEAAGY